MSRPRLATGTAPGCPWPPISTTGHPAATALASPVGESSTTAQRAGGRPSRRAANRYGSGAALRPLHVVAANHDVEPGRSGVNQQSVEDVSAARCDEPDGRAVRLQSRDQV